MKNILLVTQDNGTQMAVNPDFIDVIIPRVNGRGTVLGLAGDSDNSLNVVEHYDDIISTLYALGVRAWRIRPAAPPPSGLLSLDKEAP